MWQSRSIALAAGRARSCFTVAVATRQVRFPQILSSKPSLYQYHHHHLRFLSHSSDEDVARNEYGNTQMDHFADNGSEHILAENNNDDIHMEMENSMGFGEYDDTQMDANEGEGEGEGKVYEIDVDKLENLLSLLQSSSNTSLDGSLDSTLGRFDLDLHEEFVVKVLETPHILGENLIGFFKWVMKHSEYKINTSVIDILVKTICNGGNVRIRDVYALWDLVKEIGGMKENAVLTGKILNELITVFLKLGKGKAAFEVFNMFGEYGFVENEDTYYFTIEALCRRSIFDWAWSVCEKMVEKGILPDSEKIGKIISWFCKGSKAKEAHLLYKLAKEKNKCPPQSSVNILISSLCQKDGTVKLALDILDDFSGEARKYAIKPFSSVVHSLCRTKDVDKAKTLLSKMISEGPPPGNAVFNYVISAYSKAGDMKQAIEIMKLMESRGLKPDVYTYTVVMSGYANGGQMKEACEILHEAEKNHSMLSAVTYHTLIRGYCKLEEFDNALKLLNKMKDAGVQPNVDEYNKLIQSLCLKALDWRTAEELLEEMKLKGLHLNGITRGLIRAAKELEQEALQEGEVLSVL